MPLCRISRPSCNFVSHVSLISLTCLKGIDVTRKVILSVTEDEKGQKNGLARIEAFLGIFEEKNAGTRRRENSIENFKGEIRHGGLGTGRGRLDV